MADPTKSWVAKWQWLNSYVPGVYAVKVVGTVSDSLQSRNAVGTKAKRLFSAIATRGYHPTS